MRKLFIMLAGFFVFTTNSFQVAVAAVPASSLPSSKPDSVTVNNALEAFRLLTSKEKKARFKEVKKEIKNYKKAKRTGKQADTNTLLLVILAILLPPLAVYLYEDAITNHFWISLILTLLGWLPGIIYSLVIILGKH